MTSVIVPAHDEESSIERCLAAILGGARSGEFEIIVVCNGCSDRTAEVARGFAPTVRVLEIPEASKVAALNVGDRESTSFPRFYVDADVMIDTDSLRRLRDLLLNDPGVHVASPTPMYELDDVPRRVAAYYRVWQCLPSVRQGLVGAGVYGLSRAGHAEVFPLPDVINDDFHVEQSFSFEGRRRLPDATARVQPVHTLGSLMRRKDRVYAGNAQTVGRSPLNRNREVARALFAEIGSHPAVLIDLPVFLGVTAMARMAHARHRRRGEAIPWGRDATSR